MNVEATCTQSYSPAAAPIGLNGNDSFENTAFDLSSEVSRNVEISLRGWALFGVVCHEGLHN